MTEERKQNSLRLIVLLATGLSFVIFIVLIYGVFQTSISDMLGRTESRHMEERFQAVNDHLSQEFDNMDQMALDLANWESTVEFCRGESPGYVEENWPGASITERYGFDFIVIQDLEGRDLYNQTSREGTGNPISADLSQALIPHNHAVLEQYEAAPSGLPEESYLRSGVLFHGGLPYYIASSPVALLGEGEPAGVLFFGNLLDNAYLRSVTRAGSIDFALEDAEAGGEPVENTTNEAVSLTIPLERLGGGRAPLTLTASREVYQEGAAVMRRTNVILVLAMALLTAAIYLIVSHFVFTPLDNLTTNIKKINKTGADDLVLYSNSREFVALSSAINEMLRRLNRSSISVGVFKSILDGIDACLYATDIDTDELLFINDKMIQEFQMKGQAVGQPCWKLVQKGKSGRCDFCPVPRLLEEPDSIVTWEEHNSLTGRYYRNSDRLIEWIGGKLAHLQYSVDITEVKLAELRQKRRLEQQELMSAMSRSFISMEDTSVLIDNALRMTGRFLDVSRILIGVIDLEQGVLKFSNEWVNEEQGVTPMGEMTSPFAPGDSLHEAFVVRGDGSVASDDVEHDPGYSYLLDVGVRAFIDVPIFVSGELWGLLCIDQCVRTHAWSASDIQLLNLIGSVIGGAVTRGRMEENLMQLSSIVESAPQYITYVDENGQFNYINQGAVNMTGYTVEELRAGGLALIFDEEAMKAVRESFSTVIERGGHHIEAPIIHKNGERRILDISAFTTKARQAGVGAIGSDITEQRRLERELIEAKEQAEQSSRAKGDFLSRMSHEMRTPMNAIIGMTTIAKSSDDVERLAYCLGRIDEASKHLLGVINDILDMSKIESGKLEISESEFEFERMLMKVTNVINFRVDEKHQNLIINVAADVPPVIVADEQRLSQVITNLFSNAVKFTPEQGTITLDASLEGEADGICTLRIAVTDTGIGISPEQQAKLFRSFEQADGSISRKFGGTGLGLAISKSIVELMGGSIHVESELDKGASFVFTIQCRRGSGEARTVLPEEINWSTLRILAVDDSADVRDYFLNFGKSMGIPCTVAADGFEAVDMIFHNKGKPFNIIFVDWKMPGMNGVELTNKIRPKLQDNVIVVMISASEWSDVEAEAKSAGITRFLPKPLFASRLVDCITECVGTVRKREESQMASHADQFLGKRILLAEDIEINREIVLTLLDGLGLVIDWAEDGRQAVEMYRGSPDYDLIFMDIHMPEVDGYEATRRIRALDLPKAATVPIVAMTANVFREDIERCLAAGMNDHIGKPIDLDEILSKLERYL